jgi:hypothetical protein
MDPNTYFKHIMNRNEIICGEGAIDTDGIPKRFKGDYVVPDDEIICVAHKLKPVTITGLGGIYSFIRRMDQDIASQKKLCHCKVYFLPDHILITQCFCFCHQQRTKVLKKSPFLKTMTN